MDVVGILKNADGMLIRPDTLCAFIFAYNYVLLMGC